ncbi:MAG: two-component regulator propeller domain-containing protein [Candidatus Pseudobacter hemicellulosilyticus]|uniref:histidine kinase n=1 Tax=Candidatus Pseudobacter hemicellulosilyticus TaxID=3121375 RepID=A0AAJ5WVG5_9BACT|nr:MAG: two-component regulator propeller domain-containing protein [Pseudobacter sp.]
MFFYYRAFWFFLLLLTAGRMSAQPIAFQHLTVENGLSQNAVLAISQDQQGFVWIGTSNGLNRYDGYQCKVYQSRASDSATLSDNSIISLLHDSGNNCWVGTHSGLNKYQPERDQFQRIHYPSPSGNPIAWYCLYEDRQGRVWAGTSEGLFRLEKDRPVPVALPAPPDGSINWNIRALLEDRAGNWWIGTTNGLLRLQQPGSNHGFTRYQHHPADPQSISSNFISALEEDRVGRIWIGTLNSGLNMATETPGQFRRFLHQSGDRSLVSNNIRKILADHAGRLWIGTQEGISVLDDQGRSLYTLQQHDSVPESLSQNSVHSLYQDRAGTIWAGTYFGGLNYTYTINAPFEVLRKKDQPFHLSNNVISSITEDERHNLWIGTEGGGLNYYDRSSGHFRNYRHNPADPNSIGSNLVKVVYRDWQGQIWCGTHGGGLNLFDPVKQQFKRFLHQENDPVSLNAEIVAIREDSKGRLWVGSTFGIQLFLKTPEGLQPVRDTFTRQPLFKATANYFLEDDQKRIWISTNEGLYLLEGNQFRRISTELVNCIVQDSRSQIWLGLLQGGLARYDAGSRQLEYHNQPGKVGKRNVLGILEDNQQQLWLSTDNGLFKYHPGMGLVQQFNVNDGLAGNAFNYNSFFRDSRGEFFFGGFNGITHFFPEAIQANPRPGQMVLTGLRLFNERVEPGDAHGLLKENITRTRQLQLRHNENGITLEFALLSFIKSSKNSYAYKLEGYDKDWIYSATPVASYANLPAGSYQFLVKGANNDGVWSDPVQLDIEVLPPFWFTWWAYCLYVLAIGGIGFLVLRYFFLGALLKKEEELHQQKLNFFTNISHEIRTHLTLIMAPVEKMRESEESTPFMQQQLDGVKQNANRLLKLVSELMDFRKAETGHLKLSVDRQDMIPFLEDIYSSFRELSIQKGITTSFIYDGGPLWLYFDKEQLEKVFFNLLTNAVRFTPRDGRIWLQVEDQEKEVIITVTDNGRGIAPEYLDKVFTNFFQVDDHGVQNTGYGIGLALARNIVTLHKGSIRGESRAQEGPGGERRTSFIVALRKGNTHFGEGQLRPMGEPMDAGTPIVVPEATAQRLAEQPRLYSVLVVEDNTELRSLIRETFAGEYIVLEAADGEQGLSMAISEIPDLIISDVMMPRMDGFELCRQLKTDGRTSHIPVILLTAKSTHSDQVSGLENGADLYITKPFSTRVLALNVRNLLSARERWRQLFQLQVSALPAVHTGIAAAEPILPVNPVEDQFLQQVIRIIEENLDNPDFGVEMLSRQVAMSAPVLYKKIKAVSNMSVNDFVKSLRLKKAAQLLSEKKMIVYEVAYAVGYNDRKYFSREFKKQFGKTPSEWARDV